MPIKIGATPVIAVRIGTTVVNKVYSGPNLVFDATGGSPTYLTQAANFGANRLQSDAAINLSDSANFTLFLAVETPATFLSTDQYIINIHNDRMYLRVRNSDKKLLFRSFDSAGAEVAEILSSFSLSPATKYLIGISCSASGNTLWLNGAADTPTVNTNAGTVPNWTARKLTIGGRWNASAQDLGGRIGPLWMKSGTADDFSTAWANYHDGTGFLDAQNGAFTRMAWADFNSDGSSSAAFSVLDGGTVTLEAW